MTAKKQSKKPAPIRLPKGDKAVLELVITCERGHQWYVEDSEETGFVIHTGCREYRDWDSAFEHYRPCKWFSESDWSIDREDSLSDEELDNTRKRCIQRLKYLQQEWQAGRA